MPALPKAKNELGRCADCGRVCRSDLTQCGRCHELALRDESANDEALRAPDTRWAARWNHEASER